MEGKDKIFLAMSKCIARAQGGVDSNENLIKGIKQR